MPKSKEFVSESESESEEEKTSKRKHKADKKEKAESSKKPKPSSKEKDEEDEGKWDLGNSRYVLLSEFKGKMYVNIREMYLDKEGEMKPGKKGIALSMIQWRKFMDYVEEIDKAAKAKC